VVSRNPLKGWLPMALGLLLVVLGAVWTLQGLGILKGSVMTGVSTWAIAGPIVALAGLVLIVTGVRIRTRAKRH
jgi:hypothetical protein